MAPISMVVGATTVVVVVAVVVVGATTVVVVVAVVMVGAAVVVVGATTVVVGATTVGAATSWLEAHPARSTTSSQIGRRKSTGFV